MKDDFDVFLCHNSEDKPAVRDLGSALRQRGLKPWLDEWELRPGYPWQRVLEEQIDQIRSAAVCVGQSGIGPWQQHELEAFLHQFVDRGVPVIPVLLPRVGSEINLPPFIRNHTWVDFRDGFSESAIDHLFWGITGRKRTDVRPKTKHHRFSNLRLLQQAVATLLNRMGFSGIQSLERSATSSDLIFRGKGSMGEDIACACIVRNSAISSCADGDHNIDVVISHLKQTLSAQLPGRDGRSLAVSCAYLIATVQMEAEMTTAITEALGDRVGQLRFFCGSDFFDLLNQHWPDFLADEASFIDQHLALLQADIDANFTLDSIIGDFSLGSLSSGERKIYVRPSFHRVLNVFELELLTPSMIMGAKPPSAQWGLEDIEQVEEHHDQLMSSLTHFVDWNFISNSTYVEVREVLESLKQWLNDQWLEQLKEKYRGDSRYRGIVTREAVKAREYARLQSTTRARPRPKEARRTSSSQALYENMTDAERASFYGAQQSQMTETRRTPPMQAKLVAENALPELQDRSSQIAEAINSCLRPIQRAIVLQQGDIETMQRDPNVLSSARFLSISKIDDMVARYPTIRFVQQPRRVAFEFSKELFRNGESSALIVGGPGSGKTAFCRWNALRDAERFNMRQSDRIPIYVPLHRLATSTEKSFVETFLRSFGHSGLIDTGNQELDSQMPITLYLDGLDEVPLRSRRESLMNLARTGLEEFPNLRIVVTARDYIIEPWLGWLPRVSLSGLDLDEVKELAFRWFEGDTASVDSLFEELQAGKALNDLMSVPLLATLVILVYRANRHLPQNKARLYQMFVDLLGGGWDLAKNVLRDSRFGAEVKLRVASALGSELHCDSVRTCDRNKFRAQVGLIMPLFVKEADSLLEELVVDGFVIIEGGKIQFRHHSFQEFFAARDFVRDLEPTRVRRMICEYLEGNDWWNEVLRFYVVLSEKPKIIVRWLFQDSQVKHYFGSDRYGDLVRVIHEAYPDAHVESDIPWAGKQFIAGVHGP